MTCAGPCSPPEPCLLPWFTACCSAWALRKLGTTAPPISLPFPIKTGFYILFYLCAVLPYGCGYLEDRLSGYWRFLQTRCSSTRYSVSKVLATALSGALVVLAGSFLFVVILRLQYSVDNDFRVDYSGYDAIISMGHPYLYFLVKSLISAALGSAFAVVALYLSTFLRNMIATLAVPLVLYYTVNELTVFGLIPNFLSPTVMMYRPLWKA